MVGTNALTTEKLKACEGVMPDDRRNLGVAGSNPAGPIPLFLKNGAYLKLFLKFDL